MKLKVFTFLSLFFSASLQAQSFVGLSYSIDLTKKIEFSSKQMIVRDYENGQSDNDFVIQKDEYKYLEKEKVPFIKLKNAKEFLCLACKDLALIYSKDSQEPLYFAINFEELALTPESKSFSASSELKEKGKFFKASNLSDYNLESSWVEGVKGYGIGESINCTANCSYIYFFNGYVSFDKPELYTDNSRVKKIKITFLDDEKKSPMFFDIADSPNPQLLDLGSRYDGRIKIEILDVYKGKKYQDTCINALLFKAY